MAAPGCRKLNPEFSAAADEDGEATSIGDDSTSSSDETGTSWCEDDLLACEQTCIDPAKNLRHCGGCDQACLMTQVCLEAACVLDCAKDESSCGSTCVDLNDDIDNCGECDNHCLDGHFCVTGQCLGTCPPDLPTPCGTTCADLSSDKKHCGACNTPCGLSEACIDGQLTSTMCSEPILLTVRASWRNIRVSATLPVASARSTLSATRRSSATCSAS
jgi:hypothetical protein